MFDNIKFKLIKNCAFWFDVKLSVTPSFQATVVSVLLYGCETWTLTETRETTWQNLNLHVTYISEHLMNAILWPLSDILLCLTDPEQIMLHLVLWKPNTLPCGTWKTNHNIHWHASKRRPMLCWKEISFLFDWTRWDDDASPQWFH